MPATGTWISATYGNGAFIVINNTTGTIAAISNSTIGNPVYTPSLYYRVA